MTHAIIAATILGLGALAAEPAQSHQVPAASVADPPADKAFPAALAVVTFPSHGVDLDATLYLASGRGPHGAVVLLDGLSGYQVNGDLAQAIRRAGWNVLLFHYRGMWGARAALSRSHRRSRTRRRPFGSSATQLHPVLGVTASELFAEAARHATAWDYLRWTGALRGRALLLVTADDQNRTDMDALAAALRKSAPLRSSMQPWRPATASPIAGSRCSRWSSRGWRA